MNKISFLWKDMTVSRNNNIVENEILVSRRLDDKRFKMKRFKLHIKFFSTNRPQCKI